MVGVSVRTVLGFLRHVAHLAGTVDGRGGAVAVVQRFGGAMNLNVHVHALVIDGVFARDGPDVRFCPAPLLTAADIVDVLATIVPRVRRLLERRGLGDDEEGFALEAGVWVPAGQRDRLERLCRYALRPTVAQDRLRLTAEGQVVLQLRHPWSDGTTHLLFDPLELLERLAVLTLRQAQGHPEPRRGMIPRPRINLILYHGVLGPRAAWRSLVVGFGNTTDGGEATSADGPTAGEHVAPRQASATESAPDPPCGRERRPPREEARRWADLMRRTFGLDVLACQRGGPSTTLRAILSTVEGWRALPADRADRRCGGDRAHSAPSATAHRGPNTASGAGAAPRRRSGRPEPRRRAPPNETCSFNQDTDIAVFDSYA